MITTPSLMLALCLALPTALAQPGGQAPPQDTPTEPGAKEQPEQPQQPQQPQGQQPQGQQEQQPGQQPEAQKDMKMEAKVEASVRTAALGVQMVDAATSVLDEMVSLQPLERSSVREVVALADHGVDTAKDNAKELQKMKDLPEGERNQAKQAVDKLDEAHATIRKMKRQVGRVEHIFHENEAENIRTDAMKLRNDLDQAKQAIEQIATAHQIQLEMKPQERSAAR